MARELVLDTREWIEIKDTRGNVTGGFYWNPSDLDVAKRCEKVVEVFENLHVDENAGDDELYKVSDEIKKQFEYLLNTDVSALFQINPLSPRPDGTLYAEYLLDVITTFIETEMDVRIKHTSARIKKYTDKYKK
jgi:hypothetical protein|nr:MAG TPA: tail assembly chaperone [Caudoviricetes sp.]DAH31908.1 MAG TPA: tail assembly chaperone [Caudoviricetes sp.]DAR11978.1 MAG TPA: hypothetical protein [Bacteriophage sp.]